MNKLLVRVVFFLMLTGCSNSPSNHDVEVAIKDWINSDYSDFNRLKFFGIPVASAIGIESLTVNAVEKISCKPDGENAVICEVAIDFTTNAKQSSVADSFGLAGNNRRVQLHRLVKTSKGWIVAVSK